MRVGIAIPSLSGGGAELVTRQWTDALAARGHQVYVYTVGAQVGEIPEMPAVSRVFRGRLPKARWVELPLWLRRQVRRDRLDALITMMMFANLSGLVGLRTLLRPRVALVIVEHNVMTLALPTQGGPAATRSKLWLARRLYRRADAAIGVSHAVVTELIARQGVDPSRAFAVPNPILGLDPPTPQPPPRVLNVAFVGRLTAQKCPLLYVETLAALKQRGVEVVGTMLGEGPMRDEVEAYGISLDIDLDFRGWREPWWSAAADVDCLLLPSAVEGFGNVFVEAASAGIPSVARSSALGTGESVVPGLTGELVLGSDPEQLADGVLKAVGSRGADPLRGWLSRFSAGRSAELLLEVLSRAVR